jgi:hypothetical protein
MTYTNAGGNTFQVGFICDEEIDTDASKIGDLVNDGNDNYTTTLTGNLACPTYSLNAFFAFV